MSLHTDTPPVLLASAERTTTTSSDDVRSGLEETGAFLVFDITAAPQTVAEAEAEKAVAVEEKEAAEGAEDEAAIAAAEAAIAAAEAAEALAGEAKEGTLKVEVEAKDEVSGEYIPITTFAVTKKASELTAGTTLAYTVSSGAAETAATANHEVQALPMPRDWRAKVTHSAAGKWTYSLGYQPLGA